MSSFILPIFFHKSISFAQYRKFVNNIVKLSCVIKSNARKFIEKCNAMGNDVVRHNSARAHIKSIFERCGHCWSRLAARHKSMVVDIFFGKFPSYSIWSIFSFFVLFYFILILIPKIWIWYKVIFLQSLWFNEFNIFFYVSLIYYR